MSVDKIRYSGITVNTLLNQPAIPTVATSYSCNWAEYDFLIICAAQYGNINETEVVPVDYMKTTSSGTKVQLMNTRNGDKRYNVYKDGNNALFIQALQEDTDAFYIRIYGVKFGN